MARTESEILNDIQEVKDEMKAPKSFKVDEDITITSRSKSELDQVLTSLYEELDELTGSSKASPISVRTSRRYFRKGSS